jgi:hypothetical protein
MKKILLLLVVVVVTLSCNKDDDSSNSNSLILGQWKLSHVLIDPGDGSGTFEPVESGKTLIFRQDNTVTCNGSLCYITQESDIITESTYSSSNRTITSDCNDAPDTITYDIIDGELILYYQCIEACQAKYTRVPEEVILF